MAHARLDNDFAQVICLPAFNWQRQGFPKGKAPCQKKLLRSRDLRNYLPAC
jgi:hypothetical protein